jgi:hypothetical protein
MACKRSGVQFSLAPLGERRDGPRKARAVSPRSFLRGFAARCGGFATRAPPCVLAGEFGLLTWAHSARGQVWPCNTWVVLFRRVLRGFAGRDGGLTAPTPLVRGRRARGGSRQVHNSAKAGPSACGPFPFQADGVSHPVLTVRHHPRHRTNHDPFRFRPWAPEPSSGRADPTAGLARQRAARAGHERDPPPGSRRADSSRWRPGG